VQEHLYRWSLQVSLKPHLQFNLTTQEIPAVNISMGYFQLQIALRFAILVSSLSSSPPFVFTGIWPKYPLRGDKSRVEIDS
jgi:hypothetical protein